MLKTTALCMSRSRMAAATTGSPKISPHSGSPRLVVISVGWPSLIAGVHHVEEGAGSTPLDGQEPDVVDDEHARCGEGLELGGHGALPLGLDQGVDHVVSGGEVAPIPGLDGGGGQRHGQVGLAAPGLAEEEDRPVLLDEPQRGQVVDELSVHAGLELEVEVRKRPPEGEAGEAQPCGQLAVDRGRRLLADHPGQELDVAPFLGLGLFGQGGEALGRSVEPRYPRSSFSCS